MSGTDCTAALRARRSQQQSTPADRQPTPQHHATGRPADLVITSDMIPAPVPVETSGNLTHDEIHQLGICERAVENLATATCLAGKALQTIRDRKLYRQTHTRFDTYITERWEISERTAYQMIEEWPLAQRLNQLFGKPVTASHTRALTQVSDLFGLDAAAATNNSRPAPMKKTSGSRPPSSARSPRPSSLEPAEKPKSLTSAKPHTRSSPPKPSP